MGASFLVLESAAGEEGEGGEAQEGEGGGFGDG